MLKPTKILTKNQLHFLDLFSQSNLQNNFYLSGGTALCGFYIPYRKSEDLDFFSEIEFNLHDILVWIKSIKPVLKYKSFDIQTPFNRNLIFLKLQNEILKTEFTYFPFLQKKNNRYNKVAVDSIEDIALNKLFTIYQNPRLRDFMDFYMIINQKHYDLGNLRIDAKTKFDWDIDVVQLGSQLLKVKDLKDSPLLIGKFNYKKMEKYFFDLALSLSNEVLK